MFVHRPAARREAGPFVSSCLGFQMAKVTIWILANQDFLSQDADFVVRTSVELGRTIGADNADFSYLRKSA